MNDTYLTTRSQGPRQIRDCLIDLLASLYIETLNPKFLTLVDALKGEHSRAVREEDEIEEVAA